MNYRTDVKQDWSKTLTYVGIIFVLEFIGALSLTAGGGFSDELFRNRFLVYTAFVIFGLGFILFAQAKNKDAKKRIFLIPLHEPEEALGVGRLKAFRNPVLLALLALIVFIPVFFVAAKFANTFFSGIPFHTQAVSTWGSLWGDSGFPAVSENNLMYIPLVLLLSLNFWLLYRVKVLYWLNNIITIPLIMAFLWRWFHTLVYGSDEFASYYTFMFGYIGILLTLLTMSAILWLVIHFLSNFMLSAKYLGILPNDSFLLWVLGVWVLCWILFFTVNYFTKNTVRRGASS